MGVLNNSIKEQLSNHPQEVGVNSLIHLFKGELLHVESIQKRVLRTDSIDGFSLRFHVWDYSQYGKNNIYKIIDQAKKIELVLDYGNEVINYWTANFESYNLQGWE